MFNDFKPVIILLLRFFGLYFGLIGLYQFYLSFYDNVAADPITRLVAEQSAFCLNTIDYSTEMVDDIQQKGIIFKFKELMPTIVVEGCNALSIMILFLAFIFTFYQGKKTFVFALVGLVFLYFINIFRIAVINIVFLEYPEYFRHSHDYFFPAIIYGGVVLLWIIWIKFFVSKK